MVFFQENLRKDGFIGSFPESSGGKGEVLWCIGSDCLSIERKSNYEIPIEFHNSLGGHVGPIRSRLNRLSYESSRFRFLNL